MDRLSFWKQKIVQAFHDPPAKPYTWYPKSGGHWGAAKELFSRFTGEEFKRYHSYPDWAAAGADRPMLIVPKGEKGRVQVLWPNRPIVTHPLAGGYPFDVRYLDETEPEARAELRKEILEEELEVAEDLGKNLDDWQDAEKLQQAFIRHWRRFREELVSSRKGLKAGDPVWELMPADSRSPDHSIWDHLRVTTALAFLTSKKPSEAQKPWFFKFTIGPVQRFIQESRTSRDLWTSSFLFSDLIFSAMKPLIERYGPDCIIYPDLRGNPRADCWLAEEDNESLPESFRKPGTYAAVLPNTFTALIPRGGAEYLVSIEDLAKQARQSMLNRWQEHADMVRQWLKDIVSSGSWEKIWDRQHKDVLHTYWSAVAWEKPERVTLKESLRGRALLAQQPDFREPSFENREKAEVSREAIKMRQERLSPWVTPEIWSRYEWAREVFAYTYLNMHQIERGFDYALTHHQLSVRHKLRKGISSEIINTEEPGEKCSLCGRRQALVFGSTDSDASIDLSRRTARNSWAKNKDLDPEESGAERLCAVCAMKRFLVAAGSDPINKQLKGINPLWAGVGTPFGDVKDRDDKIRMPFPSTALIATQEFLNKIVEDFRMASSLKEVVEKAKAAGLSRTSFPRALPRLAVLNRNAREADVKDFMEFDVQNTLFPETIDGLIVQKKNDESRKRKLEDLKDTVVELRSQARKLKHGNPNTHCAVIRLDGDHMGRLLLGDEEMIGSRWKDVIHPDAVKKILESPYLRDTGWIDLLEAKRLMGPSLHAFVSRALAEFSHRFVPWVVEQEFSGRLIYSGGDDVLCLTPAEEALPVAARLQQIFSAPWIIDTNYQEDPWQWRSKNWHGEHKPDKARQRFVIPKRPPHNDPIRLPIRDPALLEPYVAGQNGGPFTGEINGRLFPMLGPACSLSAGIAYGHFKTPMSKMLKQAGHLLNDYAKEKRNRQAVALGHFSRNGVKTEFAMKWGNEGAQRKGYEDLDTVIKAFQKKQLPTSLPYKLRQQAEAAAAAFSGLESISKNQEVEHLLRGLFNCVAEIKHFRVREAAFFLWKEGISLFPKEPARSVEGLLLARELAGFNGGEL